MAARDCGPRHPPDGTAARSAGRAGTGSGGHPLHNQGWTGGSCPARRGWLGGRTDSPGLGSSTVSSPLGGRSAQAAQIRLTLDPRDPAVRTEHLDQIIDLAGGGARQIVLHDHREQPLIHSAAPLQQRREERRRPQPGDPQLQVTSRTGQHPRPVTVRVAGVDGRALTRQRADHRGQFGLDQSLIDRFGRPADPVVDLGGFECFQDFQDCRLVQGHRVLSRSARTIGVGSRWPSHSGPSHVLRHAARADYLHHRRGRGRGRGPGNGFLVSNFTMFHASTKCPQLAGSYPPQPEFSTRNPQGRWPAAAPAASSGASPGNCRPVLRPVPHRPRSRTGLYAARCPAGSP
jgi:hypothetical protein